MPTEVEDFVYSGSPSSFSARNTTLTLPLGEMLKEIALEVLEDRFSGRVDFANSFVGDSGYRLALAPNVRLLDYKYNQVENLGFAVTPQVEMDLAVEILDSSGTTIFDGTYESGLISLPTA